MIKPQEKHTRFFESIHLHWYYVAFRKEKSERKIESLQKTLLLYKLIYILLT